MTDTGVRSDAHLANEHLHTVRTMSVADDKVLLETRTVPSENTIALAARTRVFGDGVTCVRRAVDNPDEIGQELWLQFAPRKSVIVEKVVATATTRDRAISAPALAAVGSGASSG